MKQLYEEWSRFVQENIPSSAARYELGAKSAVMLAVAS
jgi:hypothetical protein